MTDAPVSDRTFSGEDSVAAFSLASTWFLNVVRTVDPDQWDRRGLDEWTVRELVAHTVRAFRTVELVSRRDRPRPGAPRLGGGLLPHRVGRGRAAPAHLGASQARRARPR